MNTKTCPRCKRELSLDCFGKRNDRPNNPYKSHCLDCNNKKTIKWRQRKIDDGEWHSYILKQNREWRRKNPSQKLIQGALERARKYNLPFDITAEDVPIPQTCPVLGISITPNIGGRIAADNSPSLDRIIPEKGYVKGNVKVISYRANMIKNAGTIEEHMKIVEYMRQCQTN